MVDTPLHEFLKQIGIIYLHNQGCSPVATEIEVRFPKKKKDKSSYSADPRDRKGIVDVVGIQQNKPIFQKVVRPSGYSYQETIDKTQVSRGVEVKCTRRDFKNGYCATGCNYNYLLFPVGLISKSEYPKGMGILEYDPDTFSISLAHNFRFYYEGLRIRKRPTFNPLVTYADVESLFEQYGSRQKSMIVKYAYGELEGGNVAQSTRTVKFSTSESRDGGYVALRPWRKRNRRNPVVGHGDTPQEAIFQLLSQLRALELKI